jgi:hypothetical protein
MGRRVCDIIMLPKLALTVVYTDLEYINYKLNFYNNLKL